MSNKILLPQLVTMLAASAGKPKKNAESFLKAFFGVLTDTLSQHESVKVRGLGNFKITRVESRKSVNVSTGSEIRIPAHYKISFTPDKSLADKVNREFAWLEIVELSDNVSNEEIDSEGQHPAEEVASVVAHLTEKQEEKSEQLGEELEKDFGDIEPVEPFGPVDPDDPEPGEPEPEDTVSEPEPELNPEPEPEQEHAPEPVEVQQTVPPSVVQPVAQPAPQPGPIPTPAPQPEPIPTPAPQPEPTPTPQPEPTPELASETEFDPYSVAPVAGFVPMPEFDPYSVEQPAVETPPPAQPEPYYITKDDFDNIVTKSDLRPIVRTIKKVRTGLEKCEEDNKKRSRKFFIWSLVFSAALIIGGFFLVYYILYNNLSPKEPKQKVEAVKEVKKSPTSIDSEDSDADVPVKFSSENDAVPENDDLKKTEDVNKEEPPKEQAQTAKTASTTAPTTPSDIKAMDKITTTRYLTTMAKEYYGNYNLWPYIYIENEGKLGHPDRIKPGTTVVIPNIEKYGIDPSNPKDIEKARKLALEIYKKYM